MLTSKQRSYLRGLAAKEDTIIYVGKGDMSENIIIQVKDALHARELIKGKVLDNSTLTPREVCDLLCAECKADGVQVIGSKFVLYKRNEQKPIIELPKNSKTKK
jgi:RNA-binding protein